jgi:hypothetical protein
MGSPISSADRFSLNSSFQIVAKYLNISIKDIEESLKDGVILCQLLNEMKKNAVRKIMMPQGEERLSTMKSTVNLNSFLRFTQINIGKVGPFSRLSSLIY